MNTPLTPKQDAILRFIQDYSAENQVPPTLREIGHAFDLSVGTVQDQVEALRRKGYLTREASRSRGVRLPTQSHQVPILGRVFAGTMHAAYEDVEGHLAVEKGTSVIDMFALRVRGDSMINAGIHDGDHVIVRRHADASDGDIVVARLEDETTVKRLRTRGKEPRLCPENPAYRDITGPFEILGVVVELRRRLK